MYDRAVRARCALALTVCLALGACSREEPPPVRVSASKSPEGRALEYLRTTQDEMGVDVLVAVQIYGEARIDSRAAQVVAAQLPRMREPDVARWRALLDGMKRPLLSAAPPPPRARVSGALADGDERARSCPLELLESCAVTDSCREFANASAGGRALTRQAEWLLFGWWRGCQLGVDVDALRREYAGRILEELRNDMTPSALFFERLAVLGSLGFARSIEPAWVESLLTAQRPEGCFPADATHSCDPRATGFALWALAHAPR